MAEINFFRGSTAQIDSIPVADGQILFDTEKRSISMDYFRTRLIMGSTYSYHYITVAAEEWEDNTVLIEYEGADDYNVALGVPNPTSIENINIVREASLSISEVSSEGIYVKCVNLPEDSVHLALQFSERIKEEL